MKYIYIYIGAFGYLLLLPTLSWIADFIIGLWMKYVFVRDNM